MGVDLPPGSGWRIGGPSVERGDGNADVRLASERLDAGTAFEKEFNAPRPQAVVAYGPAGEVVELTDRIDSDGKLSWRVPDGDGNWTVYTLAMRLTGERVKRPVLAAKGSISTRICGGRSTVSWNLSVNESICFPRKGCEQPSTIRSSTRVVGATTSSLNSASAAATRCEHHLPALDGKGDAEEVARVKSDYRETISDLVLSELIEPWAAWAHSRGQLARNQAHGSPGNWLDLYAAADIPETESFGRLEGGDGHLLMFKFASSAAHVAGRQLVSSETATWLDEHFTETLAKVKQIVDRQFLAGVNHTIYHGTAYSPADAAWPGWLFYASSQLNPQNPIWRDFPALNQYVARCQSLLQAGTPDNDVLVYWPLHDFWHNPRGLREAIRVHNADRWFHGTQLGRAAEWLDAEGFAFDYVSDRLLSTCKMENGRIVAPGSSYSAILVPHAKYMPAATLEKLRESCRRRRHDHLLGRFADEAPRFEERTAATRVRRRALGDDKGIGSHQFRRSRVRATGQRPRDRRQRPWKTFLAPRACGANRFARKRGFNSFAGGCPMACVTFYTTTANSRLMIGSRSASRFGSVALMDPMTGEIGLATSKDGQQIRLQLAPAQSMIVRMFDTEMSGAEWHYLSPASDAVPIEGDWNIEFIAGGPTLPTAASRRDLVSWTTFDPPNTEAFAGTAAYSVKFDRPPQEADRYLLDLGDVRDSARVILNGQEVVTLINSPYRVAIGPLRPEGNELRVEVTNVAANRIRDLDRRGVRWRIFHDINLVNINYRPFDASNWPVRDAGLLGPVTLQPLR